MAKLERDFCVASQYAVHVLTLRQSSPLELYTLGGQGGDKYTCGGIFVRKCLRWTVSGIPLDDSTSAKVAALDCRNL